MSGIEKEIARKKQQQTGQAKAREALKRETQQAKDDSRLEHYVGKEKSELKRGAKEAKANKDLRDG